MTKGETGPAPDLDDLWRPIGLAGSRRSTGPRGARARQSPLSGDEIVRTAIRLADAEGAGAVNMRRIAQELASGTMSLYWHIADKDHLLDLMLDAIQGEDLPVEVTEDWRADLAQMARRERAILWRHRWAVDFIGGRPPFGPNTLLFIEQSLAILDSTGADLPEALNVLTSVNTYVLGAVLREMRELLAEQEERRSGLSPEDVEAQVAGWRSRLGRSGLFPRLVGLLERGIDPAAPETRDARFEYGLACLLDGVAQRVTGSRGVKPRTSRRSR